MKQTKMPTARSANGNGSTRTVHASPGEALPADGTPSPDELIAVSAYFHSERRGFAPGSELADWFQAEAEYQSSSSRNSQ
jgi:hypothetical protein